VDRFPHPRQDIAVDVELLQQYLALDEEIYPQGLITGYYGPLTAAAVRKFQSAHGIDQVGVVGPITRARLNELFEGGWGPNEIPPGLTHAPGIQKKGGFCAVPGIAKRLEQCEGFEPGDGDGDETTLTVVKVVINNNDGTSEVEDFTLFIDEDEVESGEANELDPGDYVVSEDEDEGYEATFSGDCDDEGNVALEEGDELTCTITNDDVEPVT